VVKGSDQYELKVVSHRPGYYRNIVISVTLTLLVMAGGSYLLGRYLTHSQYANTDSELMVLRKELQQKSGLVSQLEQQVANLSLGSKVDKKANSEVQDQVLGLTNKVSELEEQVSFYRGLMSPTDNVRGLTIGKFDVEATAFLGQYRYKVIIQQVAANHRILSGRLIINIIGKQSGQEVVLPLHQLSGSVKDKDIRLRFKYFQNIEGELTLPDGFEAEKIQVIAKSSGRNAVNVEKKFGWPVSES
jgi:cell division protein FtsL